MLVVLDIGCTRPIGSRQAIQAFMSHAWWYGIQCEIIKRNAKFSFANSAMSNLTEACRIWFPTDPPCCTEIAILEQGTVPILLSLGQMKNLYFTLEMRPNIVYLTSPPLSLKRVPLDTARSTHLILDLSKVTYKPNIPSISFMCQDRALAGEEVEEDGEKKKKKPGPAPKEPGCKACRGQNRIHTCGKDTRETTGMRYKPGDPGKVIRRPSRGKGSRQFDAPDQLIDPVNAAPVRATGQPGPVRIEDQQGKEIQPRQRLTGKTPLKKVSWKKVEEPVEASLEPTEEHH